MMWIYILVCLLLCIFSLLGATSWVLTQTLTWIPFWLLGTAKWASFRTVSWEFTNSVAASGRISAVETEGKCRFMSDIFTFLHSWLTSSCVWIHQEEDERFLWIKISSSALEKPSWSRRRLLFLCSFPSPERCKYSFWKCSPLQFIIVYWNVAHST